jgi:hypothetical protein
MTIPVKYNELRLLDIVFIPSSNKNMAIYAFCERIIAISGHGSLICDVM